MHIFEVATVWEETHLQENSFMTFDLGVKVTQNIAQYPLHRATYAATKFEVATSRYTFKKIHYLTLTFTGNVVQYPLCHVTYASAKFEVATSNS